MNMAEDLPA